MRLPLIVLIMMALGAIAHEGHGKKNAPASAKTLKSPLSPAESKPELGQAAYGRSCAGCHGVDGHPRQMTPKPANLAAHEMDSMTAGEIYWVITNGIGKSMPAYKNQLTDTQRWQVVNYVRWLRAQAKQKEAHAH